MHTMWTWANGKKTIIGASLGTVALFLTGVGAIWHIDAEWYGRTIETVRLAGEFIAAGGLLHKGVKAMG